VTTTLSSPAPTGTGPGHAEVGHQQIVKVALASLIGTSIEWYDYFLYGTAAALVFNKIFFPSYDPIVGTLLAFATFSLGFLARPLGGIVFGHFGDKIGRKKMLYLTLMIMGLATACIGLLPTYSLIGIWAPVLLITMRLLQGFGLGGEWGGAVLMAVEHAPANRRGFYGSWPQLGAFIGLLLSTMVFRAANSMWFLRADSKAAADAAFITWGWRVPFLLSFALVAVGIWIRLTIAESPVFEKLKDQKQEAKMPLIEAITKHPKNILIAMGVRFAENGLFYVFTAFSLVYISTYLKMDRAVGLNGLLWAAFFAIFTCAGWGALSDKLGRRPVYMWGAVFCGLMAFPFFWMLGTKSPAMISLAIVIPVTLGHAAMYGPQASFLSEMFSARVRYSGASLGYQLASIFAGGLSPLVATYLLKKGIENNLAFTYIAYYMIALVLITVVAVYFAKETHKDGIGA
jgi:MFS transporter, MHS family, shikimate and dehydroshikimate transport protein